MSVHMRLIPGPSPDPNEGRGTSPTHPTNSDNTTPYQPPNPLKTTMSQEMAVSMLPGALTKAEFEARMDEFRCAGFACPAALGIDSSKEQTG